MFVRSDLRVVLDPPLRQSPGGVYCRRVAAFQKYSFLVVPSPGDSKVGPTDS